MGRSKFPGKPSKLVNKKRVSVLQGSENSGLHEFSEENSDYLPSDQVSFWNSRNETTTFGHDGAVQTTSVPQQREKPPSSEPPDGGGGGRRFQSVVKIDKPFNSGISTRSSQSTLLHSSSSSLSSANTNDSTTNNSSNSSTNKSKSDPDKPKKKTVTFKTVLETSDDASAVKKVYNPDNNAPLVPIIKKECLSRSVRLARSDCIVRPSRLTEILKNNANNIDKLNDLSFKITASTTTSTSVTIATTSLSASSKINQMETNNVPCLSTLTSSSTITSLNNEHDSNESSKKSSEKASHHDALVVGDKRFILPKRSVHSCRVIKPNKRFLEDMDTTVKNIKKTNISGGNNKKATATSKQQQQEDEASLSGDSKCQKQNRSVDILNNHDSCLGTNRLLGTDSKTSTSELLSKDIEALRSVKSTDDTHSDSTEDEEDDNSNKNNLFTLSTSKPFGNLFSGSKSSILRQPRLQFDFQTSAPAFNTSSASTSISPFALNQKKPIANSIPTLGNSNICGVCGSIYNSNIQKPPTFDIFSCEACRKFITKIIKRIVNSSNGDSQINAIQCVKNNGCSISPVVGNKYKNIKRTFKERCHACWLQKCLKTFNLSAGVRKLLMARLPASFSESESCVSPFSSGSSAGSSKENLLLSSSAEQKSACNNLFSNPCGNLLNWTPENIESNSLVAHLPSNALTENNATFGSSPLLRPTVLEKRVFASNSNTNTPSSSESDKKNVLEGTKSVINANNDSKTTSSASEEDSNKNKPKRTPAAPPQAAASTEVLKRQRIDLKGPRVKHVCRSASIVLGQPLATFGNEDEEAPAEGEEIVEEPPVASPRTATPVANETELSQSASNSQTEENSSNCNGCVKSEAPDVALSPPATPSEEDTIESTENIVKKPAIDIQKPLTRKISRTIANRRTLQRDGDKSSPATISTDFWENYDPAEVSQTGLGLILTESIPIRALCFLCGSAGPDPLIFCACCCEPYHQYCVEDEYNLKHSSLDDTITSLFDASLNVGANMNAITSRLNWLCPRCTVCYTCNMSSGSKVKCLKCQKNYHTTCLGTSKRLLGADRPLICANCLKCKSCATTKVTKFVGNLPLCSQCFKLRKKGNYCPICQKCYEDNDFDLKMMECGDCARWVHAKCEGLSDEQYNMLSTLPENIEFICKKCSKTNAQSSVWREAVAGEFKSGLLSVVKLLSKSRQACALLKISPRKKSSNCICHPIQASKNIQFGSSSNDYRSFDEESQISDDAAVEDVYEFKETAEVPSMKKCFCGASDKQSSNAPTLIDIKRKINACEYVSVAEFNYDMINVISAANCDELVITYKEILSETFPWFQNETKACTDLLEEDMFDSCSFTQNSEIECDQQVPVIDLPEDIEDYFYSPTTETDNRCCMLCKGIGEGASCEESRLIYSGNNFWVHINCALWSAEVFEEIDGSLQNVYSAISRGRLIKCTYCGNRGATVGCNVKSCGEHFHYPCARKAKCSFLTDKTVYCPQHVGETTKKKYVEIEKNFNIQRPVYVELDRKKKKMVEPSKVQFLIGSLVVKKLGGIFPKFSDACESLIPIDFLCTRLYWSTREPWKIVEYTVKTSVQNGILTLSTDYGRNFTVDHSNNGSIVQRGLAQIARWHSSLTANEEHEMLARQERSVKQLLEAVSQSFNNDDATEEEPQNNADLLPPEIKDAIFEDLPHELLDGISMLDIFPKLMIYEDMMNIDSKTETFLSNECTKDCVISEEDANETNPKDNNGGTEIGNNWPINLGFNHIEDAMLSAARPISSSREIKRSKSEVFPRSITSNRSQQRSSSLTFSCKIDGSSAAKRRKLSKGFQDIRIPESVLLTIGRRKEEIPIIERHRTLQSDDIKTKTFNWSAAKKYSSSSDVSQDSNSKSRDSCEKLKISQLDGMDDLLGESELNEFHHMQTMYEQSLVDCPVKCDRCNCTYRTQESFQRHLATCEPLSTSESESESARSPPIQNHNMILSTEQGIHLNGNIHPQSASIVQNLNQSTMNTVQTISSPLPCSTPTSIPISCNSSMQSIQIQSLQNSNVPITQISQGMSNIILANTQQQPQHHQTHQFFPLQTINGAAQLLHHKNEVPTVSVSTVSVPSVQSVQSQQQIFTMPTTNVGGQQIVTIAPQQATLISQSHMTNPISSISTQQKIYRVQNEKTSPKSKMLHSPAGKLRPKIVSNTTSKPVQMKKLIHRTDNRPISIVNENMQSPGIILQQNTNTQPIIVQQVSNGPHNIMSYVTDGHGPVQYLTVPSATDFKPQTHNTFITPTNPLMQGTFLQTDSSGNLILTNASTGLQMLSAGPLQIAQQTQPQVIGTLIQPQSGAVQCGVMSAEQMVLGTAPTLEMVTNPTMLLASPPVYYGLETIVQNTVMSSQQFVSTAMQGVLSQNASFSATTTQVFQASKIEPIMEVPSGYVVLNNVDGTTIMQQPTAQSNIISANVLQQPTITQLQAQPQQIHTQVQPQQINTQPIINIQQHHSQPQQSSQCMMQQQIQPQKLNTLSPAKPTAKSTPIVVTKIQPQIINKVVPNLTMANNQQQIVQDHTISTVISKANTIMTSQDNIVTVQSAQINKMPKIVKAAPLSISQQHPLKPKVSTASATNPSLMNIQPVRKLNMIRPLNKSSSVTIKPKIMSKPVNQKSAMTAKNVSQTPTLIAPKPNYTVQRNTSATVKPNNNDKNVPLQYNITLVDTNLSDQNQSAQSMSITNDKGNISATYQPTLQDQCIVSQNSMYQQPSVNIQYSTSCTVNQNQPVALHTSSIQLPSAPFNSPYANNIPTNIVNPIQQCQTNLSNNTISRPTNRVLPMQTIQPKIVSPPVPEQKISEIKPVEKEDIIEDKDLKDSISDSAEMKMDMMEKVEHEMDLREAEMSAQELTELEDTISRMDEEKEKEDVQGVIDEDFDMKTSCDDITDNDDRSESTIPEVKEKISKILENLDDECNNLNFNQKEQSLEEKYLAEQKENLDPQENSNLCKTDMPMHKIEPQPIAKPVGPHILYEIQSEDGFTFKSTSISEIWEKVFEAVQMARKAHGLSPLPEGPLADMCGLQMLGLKTNALRYLIEQLPGAERCTKYTPKYHKRERNSILEYSSDQEELKENIYGAARCEPFSKRSDYDMFSWLASRHRKQPVHVVIQPSENELVPRRGTGSNLPMAMKYRTLKETYKDYVGVFRSHIHGRGLYCTKDIEAGEMVIEYAGELIRSTLTDKRERYYDSKNIGCYMFKIDDNLVVDATMRGNAARFINHSCEPNCFSKVVDILGHKHIIIFALRRIVQGEELTYDYKFPFEEDKIPCSCRSRKCRKYLN